MGKQQSGFNGGFSGRLGNVVGYNWRGRWCVRTLPGDFHDARSEQQLEQRRLFTEMVRFAGSARRVLRIALDEASRNVGLTPSNYFIRMNKECFALQDGELTVDLPELRLSDGPVAPVAFDAPQLLDDTTISVSFEKNPLHRNCSQDDEIYIVAYCPEYKAFDFSDATARRRKQVVLQLNEAWAGKEVHLWGFVVDRAGRASQSLYIGSGVLDFSAAPECVDDEDVVDEADDASMQGEVSSADSEHNPDADRQDAVRGGGKSAARAAPFS